MSRLQVGGLALIIKSGADDLNVGKVVELVSHLGNYKDMMNAWLVKGKVFNELGRIICEGHIEQDRLMPLGDKQTQDELMKEKELECN